MPSDFLAGLIGRAFEQAPVLARWRPSMFEPEPGHAAQTMDWSESVALRPTLDRWPQAVAPPDACPANERTSAPPPPEDVARQSASTVSPHPSVTAPQRPASNEKPSAPQIERVAARAEQSPAAVSTVRVEHIAERHLETRQSVVEHREVRVERALPLQPLRDNTLRQPVRVARPAHEESARGDKQGPSQSSQPPRQAQLQSKPAILPAPAARMPLRARPLPASAAPQPAPTIQVSIGRIELRARQPPVAPRAAAPRVRAPKLGLDAYLRQREGGVQ